MPFDGDRPRNGGGDEPEPHGRKSPTPEQIQELQGGLALTLAVSEGIMAEQPLGVALVLANGDVVVHRGQDCAGCFLRYLGRYTHSRAKDFILGNFLNTLREAFEERDRPEKDKPEKPIDPR